MHNRRTALQAAAWRAQANAARSMWRMVVRDRDSMTRDIRVALRPAGGDEELYGPIRVRRLVQQFEVERGAMQLLVRRRPSLEPLVDHFRTVAAEHVEWGEARARRGR